MARLQWVSDGISKVESERTQSLIALGLDTPQLARHLLRMSWLSDELNLPEASAINALVHLASDAPGTFEKVVSMPWVADGISQEDSCAIGSVSILAMESGSAAAWLVSYPWFTDGIDTTEANVITTLGLISSETESAAQFLGMPFLDSIEPGDVYALGSLAFLAYAAPDVFRRVLSHSEVADGITDQEAAVLVLLSDPQVTNPDIMDDLLDPSKVQI